MITIDKEGLKQIQNYDSRSDDYCEWLRNIYWQIKDEFLTICVSEDQSCLLNFPFNENVVTPDALTIEYSKEQDLRIWKIVLMIENIDRFSFVIEDKKNIAGTNNYKLELFYTSQDDKFSLQIESFVKRYELNYFTFHKIFVSNNNKS